MPSSMCWPCDDSRQRTSVCGVVGEPVDALAHVPDAGVVDPAAQVRRRGDVGGDRDDALGDLRIGAREVDEEAPERLLRRGAAGVHAADVARHGARLGDGQRLAPQPLGRLAAELGLGRARGERRPRIGDVGAELGGQLRPLLVRHQRGVVGRMPLRRQPARLDRVREDHRRPVARPRRRAGTRRAGRRGRGRRDRQTAAVTSASSRSPTRRCDLAAPAAVARQPLAQLAGRAAQEPLVLLVAHRVDPLAQRVAAVALEQLAQAAAVLDGDRLPAGRLEHPAQAAGRHVRHDAVERLPVEVDDPQHLAEARDHRIDERLPDRALVELGVADERDVAPALRHVEVAGDVALRDRAPERRGRADADGARREVDDAGILGPARVALQPAELAQRRQVAAVERAEQVVDRVQHRRGVRLHGDAIGRAQVLEVERRHDADDRRRRGLVAADLDARRRRAHACWRGAPCSSRATARAAARPRAPRATTERRGRRPAARRSAITPENSTPTSRRHATAHRAADASRHATFERWSRRFAMLLAWRRPLPSASSTRPITRSSSCCAPTRGARSPTSPSACTSRRRPSSGASTGSSGSRSSSATRRASITPSSDGRSRRSPSCASPARRRSTRSPASPRTSPRCRRSSRRRATPTRWSGSASRTSPTSSASSTTCAAAGASRARRR